MEHLPDHNSRYKDVDYWDERYKTEQCFDWLGQLSTFQHLLDKHVRKEDSILVLGSWAAIPFYSHFLSIGPDIHSRNM